MKRELIMIDKSISGTGAYLILMKWKGYPLKYQAG